MLASPHPEEAAQRPSRRMGNTQGARSHPSRRGPPRMMRGPLLRMRLVLVAALLGIRLVLVAALLRMRLVLGLLAAVLSLPLAVAAAWAAEPIPSPKPIFFATGSTSGTTGGRVMPGKPALYSVTARA